VNLDKLGMGLGLYFPVDCDQVLNEFGRKLKCICKKARTYNQITGRCDDNKRVCKKISKVLFNEASKKCYTAKTDCEVSDLNEKPWRLKKAEDQCQ